MNAQRSWKKGQRSSNGFFAETLRRDAQDHAAVCHRKIR